jgi:hypothetical protein
MRRVIDTVRALTKRFASHWKGTWELGDYPIRVVGRDVAPEVGPARLEVIPWSAQIINWWQMAGHGSTRDEALANLRQNFATYRSSHEVLPRPGTGAPLEFATTASVDQHRELAHDFMSRILLLNLDDCFISDESSLWDFNTEETNEHYYKKIILLYGVDVSDVEGATLSRIFERIISHRRAG